MTLPLPPPQPPCQGELLAAFEADLHAEMGTANTTDTAPADDKLLVPPPRPPPAVLDDTDVDSSGDEDEAGDGSVVYLPAAPAQGLEAFATRILPGEPDPHANDTVEKPAFRLKTGESIPLCRHPVRWCTSLCSTSFLPRHPTHCAARPRAGALDRISTLASRGVFVDPDSGNLGGNGGKAGTEARDAAEPTPVVPFAPPDSDDDSDA